MTLKTARKRVVTVIESKFVTLVMTLVTMYALFGDDCRLALAPPSSDDVFYGLSTVALVLFTLELCANCFAKDDYIFRFYFWLDLVATLSLIPDIGWVWDEIVGSDGSSTSTGAIRAGRASRASTRAGRIVRIVRLVRLIRIAKLYKHVSEQQQHQAELERPSQIDEPSMVGKKLADLTTRRVILLVLLMLIALTLFNTSTYADEYNEAQELGIAQLHIASFSERAGQASAGIFQHLVDSYLVSASSLMYLGLHGFAQAEVTALLNAVPGFNTADLKTQAQIAYDFRTAEAPTWGFEGCFLPNGTLIDLNVTCSSTAIFNGKPAVQLEAALNIAKTTFVMLVLAAGAFLFTRDAETLVIGPIERMVNIVKRLADDPLGALHQDSHSQSMDNSETALLERTLTKIGNLLQIGFGQAGAEIIGNNMKDGALNPLIEGQKMNGIFGFCDIRQFTDATECLQEKVCAPCSLLSAPCPPRFRAVQCFHSMTDLQPSLSTDDVHACAGHGVCQSNWRYRARGHTSLQRCCQQKHWRRLSAYVATSDRHEHCQRRQRGQSTRQPAACQISGGQRIRDRYSQYAIIYGTAIWVLHAGGGLRKLRRAGGRQSSCGDPGWVVHSGELSRRTARIANGR